MPNWCNNQLTVTDATPELRAYLKDHGFSFGKINPPAAPESSSDSMEVILLQIAVWGTKWDLDEDEQRQVADDLLETGIAYFDTAWSPPLVVLEVLSGKFPDDTFDLTYCEPGNYFAGTATFKAGISHDAPADDGEVARIACEVFCYDDEPEEPVAP